MPLAVVLLMWYFLYCLNIEFISITGIKSPFRKIRKMWLFLLLICRHRRGRWMVNSDLLICGDTEERKTVETKESTYNKQGRDNELWWEVCLWWGWWWGAGVYDWEVGSGWWLSGKWHIWGLMYKRCVRTKWA